MPASPEFPRVPEFRRCLAGAELLGGDQSQPDENGKNDELLHAPERSVVLAAEVPVGLIWEDCRGNRCIKGSISGILCR